MKIYSKLTLAGLLLVGLSAFYACSNDNDDTPTPVTPPTLYQKLGGTTMVADPRNSGQMIEQGRLGLRSVVDSTIFVIAADPQLQPYFATLLSEVGSGNTTNLAILSKNLTDFFCVGTGAKNFSYTGLNMTDAHNPATNPRMAMKANNTDMDKFIGDVVIGAQKNSVPNDLIGEVGVVLESLRPQVVQQ